MTPKERAAALTTLDRQERPQPQSEAISKGHAIHTALAQSYTGQIVPPSSRWIWTAAAWRAGGWAVKPSADGGWDRWTGGRVVNSGQDPVDEMKSADKIDGVLEGS